MYAYRSAHLLDVNATVFIPLLAARDPCWPGTSKVRSVVASRASDTPAGPDWWMPTLSQPWLALGGPCPSLACKCLHIVWSDNGLVWRRPELPISQIGLDGRGLKIGLFWLVSVPSGGLGTTAVPPQSNTSVSVSYCQPVLAQFLLPRYPSCYESNTSRQCINM